MNFNKKKCLKLIKKSKELCQEGKFLWDYDKAKNKELTGYRSLLDDQIFWQSRGEFFKILELFVDKRINVEGFIQQYVQLRRSNRNASKMWKENLEAEAFAVLPKASEKGFQLNL